MTGQQKALWLEKAQGKFVVGPKHIDKPGHGELLVKIEATALNPVEWKVQKYDYMIKDYPAVLGVDSAGVVEEVGEGVAVWKKGDRVVHEGFFVDNKRATFQQYTTISAHLAAKIPDNVSTEEAASIPLALVTAAISLYGGGSGGLGLSEPWTAEGKGKYTGQPFFISAGSSSVGQLATQLAKLSGFSPIIATSSPSNFKLLRELGATHTLDRNAVGALGAEVAKITSEPVLHAFDAWSSAETQQEVYDLLAPKGKLVVVLDKAIKEVEGKNVTVRHIFGSVHLPENQQLGVRLFAALEHLLVTESIKPNPVEVLPGGLRGIVGGLDRMAEGKISGKKLVVKPQETA